MPKEKFDPNEPMEIVMERLEPVYGSDAQKARAETDPSMREHGQRAAYGILKNGGAKNQEELDALIATGWKPAERTPKPVMPPENADDSEGVGE